MSTLTSGRNSSVAIIGLGNMGSAIADAICDPWHVVGYDSDEGTRERMANHGCLSVAPSLQALQEPEFIILSLPSEKASSAVVAALLDLVPAGTTVIETGTVGPELVRRLENDARSRGIQFFDAAILSGVEQVRSATATLLVGPPAAEVSSALPLLRSFAGEIQHYGSPGAGMAAKIVNNAVSHAVMVVLLEATAIGATEGLTIQDVGRLLEGPNGGLQRPLNFRLLERVAKGEFQGGMPTEAAKKDSHIALAMARKGGVPLFTIDAAHEVYEWGCANGMARMDYSAIAAMWETLPTDLSGVR